MIPPFQVANMISVMVRLKLGTRNIGRDLQLLSIRLTLAVTPMRPNFP